MDLANALGVRVPRPDKGSRTTKERSKAPRGGHLHFEAIGSITEEISREFAERLGKDYPKGTWTAFGVMEGKLTPGGQPTIGFPTPDGGWCVVLYRHPDAKTGKAYTFCFTDGTKAFLLAVGMERPDPVLVCEGPWDAMQAYTDGFAVVTGTAGAGTWKNEWSDQLRGRLVVVVYDVDAAGKAGNRKVLAALKSAGVTAHNLALPLSGAAGEKDLSDYRKKRTAAELRELIASSCVPEAGLAGSNSSQTPLSAAIDAILSDTDIPARIRRREAAKLVIDDLSKRGDLIQAPGGRQFWLERSTPRLYDLDAFAFRSEFIRAYDINAAEPEFRHIFEAVKSATHQQGKQADVYRFCHYDRHDNLLYISAGQGRVVRLDGRLVTWIENGADGVLFEESEEPQSIPDEATTRNVIGDPLHDLILGKVNFSRGSAVILSPEQQRLILRVWIISIFFPELLPARVLLLLYGEKGSGKTSTLKAILKLLLGPRANVTPLGKEDGFNATVSHEFLLALDNVDSFCRWIEDRLATVATGQTIRLRKLYTTNQMLSFPTRCCVALTARTPRFRRDDVVDRLLILRVDRLGKFSRETDWYAEIEEQRVALWAQILRDLNLVIARLAQEPIAVPDTIRMADWGFLAATIGEALGQGDAVRATLEAAEVDKAYFLLEADNLYDLIHALAHESPEHAWKAGELFTELRDRAEKAGTEFGIKSPRALGRILHRLEPALKLMIRFEIRGDLHAGQASYVLGPLREPRKEDPVTATPDRTAPKFRDPDF